MAQLRLTIGDIAVTNEHVTSTVTIDKQTYNVSLIGLSFQKKMYQPTEVLAELEFDMSEAATPSDWKAISRENIENLFKNKKAVLDEVTINEESNEKGKLLSLDAIQRINERRHKLLEDFAAKNDVVCYTMRLGQQDE